MYSSLWLCLVIFLLSDKNVYSFTSASIFLKVTLFHARDCIDVHIKWCRECSQNVYPLTLSIKWWSGFTLTITLTVLLFSTSLHSLLYLQIRKLLSSSPLLSFSFSSSSSCAASYSWINNWSYSPLIELLCEQSQASTYTPLHKDGKKVNSNYNWKVQRLLCLPSLTLLCAHSLRQVSQWNRETATVITIFQKRKCKFNIASWGKKVN